MATAMARRPPAPIPQSSSGTSRSGEGDSDFATYVRDVTGKLQISYDEMRKQAEDEHKRTLQASSDDPVVRRRLEEDLHGRIVEIEKLIRHEWRMMIHEEISIRKLSSSSANSPDFMIPEALLRTQKALLDSVMKSTHNDSNADERRDSRSPAAPSQSTETNTNTSPVSLRNTTVWKPPPQTQDNPNVRRNTPSMSSSGAATVQGSPMDRRTSDSGSIKSSHYPGWLPESATASSSSSPFNMRTLHTEPEEMSSDGESNSRDGSYDDDESGDGYSDNESEQRAYHRRRRRPYENNWNMTAPERPRPVPISSTQRVWKPPSMETIPQNQNQHQTQTPTGYRRVPGSSLERMSTQDLQNPGPSTSTRPPARASIDITNSANRQPRGSIDSDSASWRSSSNVWGSLEPPKPPIPSRSPAASPPTATAQPANNINYANKNSNGSNNTSPSSQSQYFVSNREREAQAAHESQLAWTNMNRARALEKESQQKSGTVTARSSPPDSERVLTGRNRSDSDTMSTQSGKFWRPGSSSQSQAHQVPPPQLPPSPPVVMGASRPMDRQPSYSEREPSRSPQFMRSLGVSEPTRSQNLSVSPGLQRNERQETSRSRSPPRPERSRTYDGVSLASEQPRPRPHTNRSLTSAESSPYPYDFHPPMLQRFTTDPSAPSPSPPASREFVSRDYAYSHPKPVEDSPIQRPANMPLSRHPTELYTVNDYSSHTFHDSFGSSISSSIPSDSDTSSSYHERSFTRIRPESEAARTRTRLEAEAEEVDRKERELVERHRKHLDASQEYRERKLSSVDSEMDEVERKERVLAERKRKLEEEERVLKQREEELEKKNRELAEQAIEKEEQRKREEQEREERREREEEVEKERLRKEKEEEERRREEERAMEVERMRRRLEEEREREAREAKDKAEKKAREEREREEREEEREREREQERWKWEQVDRERQANREREQREQEEHREWERQRQREKEREEKEKAERERREREERETREREAAIKKQEEFDRAKEKREQEDREKQLKLEEELKQNGGLERQKEMLDFFARKKQQEEVRKAKQETTPLPYQTGRPASSASSAAASMPNSAQSGRAGSTSSSSSSWSGSQRSSTSSYAESTRSSATSRSTSSQQSGTTPMRSAPSSAGTRTPHGDSTPKATGWRTANAPPHENAYASSSSSSYVPPTESEWKRKQEEQARQQQERFRREALKAEHEHMSRASQSSGKDNIIRAWNKYESDWGSLKDHQILRFRIIPWPVLKTLSNPDEITANAVGALVLSPHHSQDKKARDRLKEQLLRWHPDRFEGKWLPKVVEEEKEEVKRGVGQVARALNELMNRENNNPFG